MLAPLKKSYDKTRQYIKKQRHYFANKGLYSQSYGFASSMYGYESWTINKPEHWKIDVFELWYWRRLLRICWIARRSNQSIKGNQCWIFIGKTDVGAKAPILWPPDTKSQLIGKDHDTRKRPWYWGQKEKGMTEDDGWMASLTQWTWVWANSGR